MVRLLVLVPVALALVLEGVSSWRPARRPALPAPLVVHILDADQVADETVRPVQAAAGAGSRLLSLLGGEGEGVSNLQLLVPVALVDARSAEDSLEEAAAPSAERNTNKRGQDDSAPVAERVVSAALAKTLLRLMSGLRPLPPLPLPLVRRPAPTPAATPAPVSLTRPHDRAAPTPAPSHVCPACLMLNALKMLQLKLALQEAEGRGEGEGRIEGRSDSGGEHTVCTVCVLELQRKRRGRLAGRAGPEREGRGDAEGVNLVA